MLFFPDQHLGRNTAKLMGFKDEQMCVWYPSKEDGGLPDLQGIKLILWNGNCPVHMKFYARDVHNVRKQFPACKVVVHPECEQEVVDLADAVGSTSYIVEYIQTLPKGTTVFVGTEVQLVSRLNRDHPHVRVEPLFRSLCPTMYMVNLGKLLYCLENLDQADAVPMPSDIKEPARLALERMLSLTEPVKPTV